jgi:hypothetical protein
LPKAQTRKPVLAAKDSAGRKYPLIVIEWVDSCYEPRWHLDEPTTTPTRCRSVGWLVHDGRDAKVVAPNIGDEDHGELQRNGEMTIPACAIKRMRRIR